MNQFETQNEPAKPHEQKRIGLTKEEVRQQVDKANKILSGFAPPEKKGD